MAGANQGRQAGITENAEKMETADFRIAFLKLPAARDCVAIALCRFVEKNDLLRWPTMNYF